MRKSELVMLFSYNAWANNRVMAAVTRLNPDQFTAPNPCSGYGSIRGILVHILTAELVWRERFKKTQVEDFFLDPEIFPTLETLLYRWQKEEIVLQNFIEDLSDDSLDDTLTYFNRRGESFENICWNILVHVINHGTQHRSEVATILTGYGVSPGDLDLIHFLRTSSITKEGS